MTGQGKMLVICEIFDISLKPRIYAGEKDYLLSKINKGDKDEE